MKGRLAIVCVNSGRLIASVEWGCGLEESGTTLRGKLSSHDFSCFSRLLAFA